MRGVDKITKLGGTINSKSCSVKHDIIHSWVRQVGRRSLLCITPCKSWAQLRMSGWFHAMMYEGCHNNASLNMEPVMHKWGRYPVHSI